jgi:hypothetical protein
VITMKIKTVESEKGKDSKGCFTLPVARKE